MAEFGSIHDFKDHVNIADIGCGIGGTSRALATMMDSCSVTGVAISPSQVDRARVLSSYSKISNTTFMVGDGTDLKQIESGSYDIVWICESSEHVADKAAYLGEACRILKPGGRLVMAAWCAREPRNESERTTRQYLEQEWSHPRFASIEELGAIMMQQDMEDLAIADWTRETLPSWYHSILVGVWNPVPVFVRPGLWLKTIREIYTINLMHRAFRDGLMQYGMFRASKRRI